MYTKSAVVITGKKRDSPSVKNLLQSLNGSETFKNTKVVCLPGSYNEQGEIQKIDYITREIPSFFIKNVGDIISSNVCFIHKKITKVGLGFPLIESIIAETKKTIYSTYDGVYLHSPKIADYLFRKSDAVYATSHEIKNNALKVTNKDKVYIIPPSVDVNLFRPCEDKNRYNNRQEKVVGWVGNTKAHRNDLSMIIDILSDIKDESIVFRVVGKYDNNIVKKAKSCSLNVELLGRVKHEKVPQLIRTFDIGLAPLKNTKFNRARSSEKIREYMACGVPVIASDVGENKYLVCENCGILVDDRNEWEEAIMEVLNDKNKKTNMGKMARKYVVENYSIKAISNMIDEKISNV